MEAPPKIYSPLRKAYYVRADLVKGLVDALELAEKKIERRYPMGRNKNLLLEHIRAALDDYRKASND